MLNRRRSVYLDLVGAQSANEYVFVESNGFRDHTSGVQNAYRGIYDKLYYNNTNWFLRMGLDYE